MSLRTGLIVGAVLAVAGIGLFVLVWLVLGEAGAAPAPRLFSALCLPPAVIALLLGAYVLVLRGRRHNS
jgi:lipopolysaccharide export LptBFGC system permease protein LptF